MLLSITRQRGAEGVIYKDDVHFFQMLKLSDSSVSDNVPLRVGAPKLVAVAVVFNGNPQFNVCTPHVLL